MYVCAGRVCPFATTVVDWHTIRPVTALQAVPRDALGAPANFKDIRIAAGVPENTHDLAAA